jgi:iron complex transport system permease protein
VGGLVVSALALGGALLAALLMYLLAWRDGVTGYRFILIGIGVAAFFDSLIGFVLSRAQLFEARQALRWLTGSVGKRAAASCGCYWTAG